MREASLYIISRMETELLLRKDYVAKKSIVCCLCHRKRRTNLQKRTKFCYDDMLYFRHGERVVSNSECAL